LIDRVLVEGAPPPLSHYCDVVRAGDVVWVSGVVAVEPDWSVRAPGDAGAQSWAAHEALGRALAAVGAGPEDVVKVTNYLTDVDDRKAVNEARIAFFGEHRPASVLVEVPRLALPGLLYEVDAVAVVGGAKQRICLEGGPPPLSHYCDAVRAGDLVFAAAVAAEEDWTPIAPGDAGAQSWAAHEALGKALEAVGARPRDVVKVTNYLTNVDDRKAVNEARIAFFGDQLPSSVLIEVPRLALPGLAYEVDAVAVVGGEKVRLNLEGAPPPLSHYCDVVRVGDLVFTAAVAAEEDWTVVAPGDAATQARASHEFLGRALAEVGAGPADVVKVTNFLTSVRDRAAVNEARAAFFGDHRPASTLVEVPRLALPGLAYELDAVAVVAG
jgi:2-iminobutanoate/2-iminopropanoate deaminase